MVVANGKYFGNGLGIAPDADVTDGKFSFVIIGDINLLDYFKNLGTVKNLFHKIDNLNKPNSNISQIDFYISKEKQKDISKIHKYFSILEENYIPFIDTKID